MSLVHRLLGAAAIVVACTGCPFTVTILPEQAVDAGAQWQLDGGAPQASGVTLDQVATGNHVVSFTPVAGWIAPPSQNIFVDNKNPVALTGTYTPTVSGSLMVTIAPQAAIDGGATWQVDGGGPQASGATLTGLPLGTHTVSFSDVAGFTKPADLTVTITQDHTATATGTYVALPPPTGSLKVTIAPQAAIDGGAKWQVDGGAFQNSGATVTGLTAGNHTVSFNMVQFFARPANQLVTIAAGATATITGTYTSTPQTGSVVINVEPSGARTAGGQWRIDAGSFHASGALISGLPAGTHTISFSPTPGYVMPLSMQVSVSSGVTTTATGTYSALLKSSAYTVIAYNDLGMHCMNQDFSELMILPPYNVFHATVIRRGGDPRIVSSGVTVDYRVPSNTTSVTKTNFWDYAQALFGLPQPLAPDTGLTGSGLSGTMVYAGAQGRSDWEVTGVPITPLDDDGSENAYPLAVVTVSVNGTPVAQTQNVMPVSWEISCELCHNTPGISTATDILQAHDRLHGTQLATHKPVTCGACHGQPALGMPGQPGRPTLSRAMHHAHAPRMAAVGEDVACYACHPGFRTQCLRDVHFQRGMDCMDCHGDMTAVADPSRLPWETEPRCGDCHPRSPKPASFALEQPNTLYRNSKGHHGVECLACHGSPHAITPTTHAEDNVQAIALQGHAGKIDTCTVCHTEAPDDPFPHNALDDDK